MKIRKAVIPAGGLGTRFLPVTKAQPKEMLPLLDKPLIQYAVEEAARSGMEQVIIVTSRGKQSIRHHFQRSPELEAALEESGKTSLLHEIRKIRALPEISYVNQEEQMGLGHAILMAKELVGNEPFAAILSDDIISSEVPVLKQILEAFEQCESSIIAVEHIDRADVPKYGIIEPKKSANRLYQVLRLVEKPQPAEAPSDLGIVGRYILTPAIFAIIAATSPGKGGEIQLTDALQALLNKEKVYAYEFQGTRYDTGTPLGWLKASIAFGLKHPEIGPELKEYLRQLSANQGLK